MLNVLVYSVMYLLEPVGFVWGVLLILTIGLLIKRRRRLALLTGCLVVFMSIIGSTGLPGWLLGGLERENVRAMIEDVPDCDAVVMLGGGVEPSRYDAFGVSLTADGDRPIMALELMRLGKAKTLVLGGAGHPTTNGVRIEAELVRRWFTAWKLMDAPIESLGACENTHEEVEKVAKLYRERGWKQIILVTSAYHMKRAVACFRTVDIAVVPVPCDFKTSVGLESLPGYTLVPRYQGFYKVALYLHEQIGWLIYRQRGWIKP